MVLEDGNLDDHFVDFCLRTAALENDKDGFCLAQWLRWKSMRDRETIFNAIWDHIELKNPLWQAWNNRVLGQEENQKKSKENIVRIKLCVFTIM